MEQLPQKQPNNTLLIAFLSAMGVILIMWVVSILRNVDPLPPSVNTKPTRDSILLLTSQIEEQKKITDHYLGVVDSLKAQPPKIKIIYREQKKFTSTATINQLDSIIRVHAGISKTR